MGSPTTITLKIGEEYTLRLKGLRTAGYTWSTIVTGDEQAISLSKTMAPPLSATSEDVPRAGGNTDELLTIQAQTEGNATIQLVQRRAWETPKPSAEHTTIEVHIQASSSNN